MENGPQQITSAERDNDDTIDLMQASENVPEKDHDVT